jgi:hypothetical protein
MEERSFLIIRSELTKGTTRMATSGRTALGADGLRTDVFLSALSRSLLVRAKKLLRTDVLDSSISRAKSSPGQFARLFMWSAERRLTVRVRVEPFYSLEYEAYAGGLKRFAP